METKWRRQVKFTHLPLYSYAQSLRILSNMRNNEPLSWLWCSGGDPILLSYRESNHDSPVIQPVSYPAFRGEFAVNLRIRTASLNLPLCDPTVTRIAAFYSANNVQIKVHVFWDKTACRVFNYLWFTDNQRGVISDIITNRHGVITQKALIFISSALRTFNLATWKWLIFCLYQAYCHKSVGPTCIWVCVCVSIYIYIYIFIYLFIYIYNSCLFLAS